MRRPLLFGGLFMLEDAINFLVGRFTPLSLWGYAAVLLVFVVMVMVVSKRAQW